ncbi:MAG: hypothetical protein V1875_09225 [Candidatus Altiarchaeota archaeon]
MKAISLLPVLVLLAGCLIPQAETQAPLDEVHYVSSNPALAGCNRESTVDARETCYVEVADKHTDPDICEDVGSLRLRNLCYHKVSKTLENPGLCFKIRNDDWRYTDCVTSSSQ